VTRLAPWLALLLAACAQAPSGLPDAPLPAGPAISVISTPVALNPQSPGQDRLTGVVNDLVYSGGLELTARDTAQLHGLSDLRITAGDHLVAVGDEGSLFRAGLALDRNGRLTGLYGATLAPLTGEDGKALARKEAADAEGLAILADGRRLVSYEREHRILLYEPGRPAPRPAPSPGAVFPLNAGMEALTAYPAAGPDAYWVGAEVSGQTWVCRLAAACAAHSVIAMDPQWALTALVVLPDGRSAILLRAFDPLRGARIRLRITDAQGRTQDEYLLERPITVDNFEGVAAVQGRDGAIRLYLLSDDNFRADQRTLLLAFDLKPR
jgi:hypothetical protein